MQREKMFQVCIPGTGANAPSPLNGASRPRLIEVLEGAKTVGFFVEDAPNHVRLPTVESEPLAARCWERLVAAVTEEA